MKYVLVISAIIVSTITTAQAASVCRGLTQQTCENAKIDNVPVCRWQGEYFTTSGKRGNYCTTSGKKLTPEQFSKLEDAIKNGSLIAQQ